MTASAHHIDMGAEISFWALDSPPGAVVLLGTTYNQPGLPLYIQSAFLMTFSSTTALARVTRAEKEKRLGQRGTVMWLYGLSGSGKSTLATALERTLTDQGLLCVLLDGDEIRSGLNRGLGFSDADRTENLRRAAEVARLFAQSGLVVIAAFITPLRSQRDLVRSIVGSGDLMLVHLSASFGACARRDPKGLYAKAAADKITQFTGRDSAFETPPPGSDSLVMDTEAESPAASLARLQALLEPRIRPT